MTKKRRIPTKRKQELSKVWDFLRGHDDAAITQEIMELVKATLSEPARALLFGDENTTKGTIQ